MVSLLDKLKAAATSKGGIWLDLKPEGEFKMAARIHFLQEIDEDSKFFNNKYGQAHSVDVHTHPADFKKSSGCSFETEGKCLACEKAARGGKEDWKWKPRTNFLVNVLVKVDGQDDVVRVLRKKMGKKDIGVQILEYNEEYEGITDRDYRYKRTGTGMNDTSYTLTPINECPIDFDGDLHDLTSLITTVPYAEQEAFWGGDTAEEAVAADWAE